jgi:hypothetical protein
LLPTREASANFSTAERTKINTGLGIDITGVFTTFVIRAGSLLATPLSVPDDVEIDRNASSFKGGGSTTLWYRWGYIYHPTGYSWAGPETEFVSNAGFRAARDADTASAAITDAGIAIATAKGVWERKATSVLSLGILPVFHA